MLKENFLLGMKEGWTMFWSPFVGLYQVVVKVLSRD